MAVHTYNERLRAARSRATEKGLVARPVPHNNRAFYVNSASLPALDHYVAVDADGLFIDCTCQGGQRYRCCQHYGAVLNLLEPAGFSTDHVTGPAPIFAADAPPTLDELAGVYTATPDDLPF